MDRKTPTAVEVCNGVIVTYKTASIQRVLAVLSGLALLLAVMGTSDAAAQKKKKKPRRERTVEMPYTEPAVGTAGVGVCFQGSSCVFVEPARGERYATVEITDDFGLPVYASIIQDTSGDGNYLAADDETVHICGSTTEPIEIEPSTVTVWVWQGPGAVPPCPGFASSGTVKVTFSNKP